MLKNSLIVIFLFLIAGAVFYVTKMPETDDSIASAAEKNVSGAVVVELFTSEGCSSCPAAEEVFGELLKEYGEKKLPVFFLAYHVDYWNYLGWNDRFSSMEFTQRQQSYANAFGLQSVYTPQMIVNGQTEFVGSNRSKAEHAIEKVLSSKSDLQIDLKGCFIQSDSAIKVVYLFSKPSPGVKLNFAVVEQGIARNVTRGENAGKRLIHYNVVRAMKSVSEQEGSEAVIYIPPDVVLENASVIAFAQVEMSMEILAASSINIITKP
jgi:hypothetical protein